MKLNHWVPMRWPCGPLEIERGERQKSFRVRERDALQQWSDPAVLEKLAGSPVSCLVVTWADGSPTDEAQQSSLAPLVAAARDRGLAVVGQAGNGCDLRQAAATADAAGLVALATESREPGPGFPVLRFGERTLGERSPGRFVGVSDAPWPGLKVSRSRDYDAWSGVTGPPWVDSNAWFVRLAQELVDPGAVWLSFDAPESRLSVPATAYVQAIADCEIYGGRWVVSLDPRLRLGLLNGRKRATKTWAEIGRALAFFEARRDWVDYHPVGRLGVVSDFAGSNEFVSLEMLNLLARQSRLYRAVERSQALAASFDELKAIAYVDEPPPEKALLRRLYAFAEQGGTLITPPGWERRGERLPSASYPRFQLSRCGEGRLAVAREELSDPYLLADDAQLLMSHRHDLVRVFNPGTARFHYSTSEDHRSGVLHVFRYGRRPFETQVSVWFRKAWESAGMWQVDAEEAQPAERVADNSGVEFHVPSVAGYCALEVSA